jgi:hypothetical protein
MPHDSYSPDRLTILRCGMGRDSIAMLCLLIESGLIVGGRPLFAADVDAVVFTDVGAEWKVTTALVPRIRAICEEHGLRFLFQRKPSAEHTATFTAACRAAGSMKGVERPWRAVDPGTIEARCEVGWYHHRVGIIEDYASRNTVVRFADGGSCTSNHKIAPGRALMHDLSVERFGVGTSDNRWGNLVKKGLRRPHRVLLGIAADEAQRAVYEGGPRYEQTLYPLVEMGVTKAHEAPILARWGLEHTTKSGCTMCKFQSEAWYYALSVLEPDTFARVVAYEANALDNGREAGNRQYLKPAYKTLDGRRHVRIAEVVADWRKRNPDASVEAIMAKDYKRCDRADGKPMSKAQREALAATAEPPVLTPSQQSVRA